MNTDMWNPVQVEDRIREVVNAIAKGIGVCDQAYRAWLDASRVFDLAYARAYMAYDGPAHERRYHADIATESEREARDAADAAHRYADRTAKRYEAELRALQSIGASIRQAYANAGTGER